MPWHRALDQASERRLGTLQIGTTRRGIGPAYADKAARLGHSRPGPPRREDPPREDRGGARREERLARARLRDRADRPRRDAACYEGWPQRLRPYVADTSLLVDRALRAGKHVLFEGAQGTLLDLDHGTYPFVTSSNPWRARPRRASGSGRRASTAVVGVAKAYVTRVGEGPFPTEIQGADQERMRRARRASSAPSPAASGAAAGSTSLRCGTRCASTASTSLALTKLDVLSDFAEIPVCVRYRLRDGTETSDFPAHQSDFHHCEPVVRGAGRLERADRGGRRFARSPARRAATSRPWSASSTRR